MFGIGAVFQRAIAAGIQLHAPSSFQGAQCSPCCCLQPGEWQSMTVLNLLDWIRTCHKPTCGFFFTLLAIGNAIL
jgi:hypothetical protein